MKNGDYELVIAPEGYPGKRYRGRYAYEHQVVWWENTGDAVSEGVCIHHENGDKRDNSFGNLSKISKEEHGRLHASSAEMASVVCAYCGEIFEREARHVKSKRKRGQKDFYCGRSCGARHFGRGRKKDNAR